MAQSRPRKNSKLPLHIQYEHEREERLRQSRARLGLNRRVVPRRPIARGPALQSPENPDPTGLSVVNTPETVHPPGTAGVAITASEAARLRAYLRYINSR